MSHVEARVAHSFFGVPGFEGAATRHDTREHRTVCMDGSLTPHTLYVHIHGGDSHSQGTLTVASDQRTSQQLWDCLRGARSVLRALDGNTVRVHGGTLGAVSFFRDGISPAWEDPSLVGGSVLKVTVPPSVIVDAFEHTVLLLRSPVKNNAIMTGARAVKSRAGKFRVELWCSGRVSEAESFRAYIEESCGIQAPDACVQEIPVASSATNGV